MLARTRVSAMLGIVNVFSGTRADGLGGLGFLSRLSLLKKQSSVPIQAVNDWLLWRVVQNKYARPSTLPIRYSEVMVSEE